MRHTRYQGAIVRDDSILLIRHLARSTGNRYWVMPGGGIEADETEIECVAREMREETSLDVRIERLLIDARPTESRFYRRQKTYLCTPTAGIAAPGFEPEEEAANFAITDVRWFDLADPRSWFDYIGEDDWVVPLLWAVRAALGYPGAPPERVKRLEMLAYDEGGTGEDLPSAGGSILVRPARTTDLSATWRILSDARERLREAGVHQWPDGYPDEMILAGDLRAGNLCIAEIDGEPAGIVSASEEFRREHRRIHWRCQGTALSIHRLAVVPAARRRGVASSLLRSLEHRARELRYNAIRMEACTNNEPAVALCESRGYRRVGVIKSGTADFLCFERSCRKPPKE